MLIMTVSASVSVVAFALGPVVFLSILLLPLNGERRKMEEMVR